MADKGVAERGRGCGREQNAGCEVWLVHVASGCMGIGQITSSSVGTSFTPNSETLSVEVVRMELLDSCCCRATAYAQRHTTGRSD